MTMMVSAERLADIVAHDGCTSVSNIELVSMATEVLARRAQTASLIDGMQRQAAQFAAAVAEAERQLKLIYISTLDS